MKELKIVFDGGPLNGQEGTIYEDQIGDYFEFYTVVRTLIGSGSEITPENYEHVITEDKRWLETYHIDKDLRAIYLGSELVINEEA